MEQEDIKIKSNRGRKRIYPVGYTSWEKAKALAEERTKYKQEQTQQTEPVSNYPFISAFVETLTKEELKFLIIEIKKNF